jgi:hypothetical protein
LNSILMSEAVSRPFDHLTAEERRAILEILAATKPDFTAATQAGAAK